MFTFEDLNPPSCSEMITEIMPFSVGRIYIEYLQKMFINFDIKDIIENIKREYILTIKSLDWMDTHLNDLYKYVHKKSKILKYVLNLKIYHS